MCVLLSCMMTAHMEKCEAQTCKHQIGVEMGCGGLYPTDMKSKTGERFGIFYTGNISQRLSLRMLCAYVNYGGQGKYPAPAGEEDIKYDTEFVEMSFQADMTFVKYLSHSRRGISPYVGACITGALFPVRKPHDGTWDSVSQAYTHGEYSQTRKVIPALGLSVGVKMKAGKRCEVDLHAQVRHYLSDDMDFSHPPSTHINPSAEYRMAGSSGWDVYLNAGVRISYLWGREDCYCM